MEFYEWKAREERTFTILRWEKSLYEITPRDGRPTKTILVIRIHLPEEEKPTFPHYWDLGGARLTGQLLPILEATRSFPIRIRVKADVPAPKTHYEVDLLPA